MPEGGPGDWGTTRRTVEERAGSPCVMSEKGLMVLGPTQRPYTGFRGLP